MTTISEIFSLTATKSCATRRPKIQNQECVCLPVVCRKVILQTAHGDSVLA